MKFDRGYPAPFWTTRVTPNAMIMCPCVGGFSHDQAEEITPDWAGAGTDVRFHAVLDVAGAVR